MDRLLVNINMVALLVQGVLGGIQLCSFVFIIYLALTSKKTIYIILGLFGFASLLYLLFETLVLGEYILANFALGREFNRLQALIIFCLIFFIPILTSKLVDLPPLWRRLNLIFTIFLSAVVALAFLIAFLYPDAFLSVAVPLKQSALQAGRWSEARGQPGIVYLIRDILALVFLQYMLVSFIYGLIKNNKKYYLLPLIGTILMISFSALDILLIYLPIFKNSLLQNFSSFTNLGIISFNILTLISIIKRLQRESLEFEKLKRIEALGEVASSVAHDFNNMLTVIEGHIVSFKEEFSPSDPKQKSLAEVEKATQRAKDLAEQLMMFSRGGRPRLSEVVIAELLQDLTSFISQQGKVILDLQIAPDLMSIYGDRTQLNQVFENIVFNALQAMPDGGRLTITAQNVTKIKDPLSDNYKIDKNLAYVKIAFKDTGHGISKENLAKIFDPFFSTKGRRHGLGLKIASTIIARHGGFLTVESEEGKGSCFNVYLPAVFPRRHVPK